MNWSTSTLLFAFIAATLLGCMFWLLRSVRPPVTRLQLTFSPEAFFTILAKWTRGDIERVRFHFYLDYLFLIAYGSFGYLLAADVLTVAFLASVAGMIATWTLPAAGMLDAIENAVHIRALDASKRRPPRWMFMVAGSPALAG